MQSKIILSLIILAVLSRFAFSPFIGHPANFSALDSVALFFGAYISRRIFAIAIVLLTVCVSDLLLNKMLTGAWMFVYPGFYWQYASYILITLLGSRLTHHINPWRILSMCLLSSILFFVVSNFGVWYQGMLYPRTMDGLMICYIAAIPFFQNTLLSDLFFTALLFGVAWARGTRPGTIRFTV